jgi:hypothetical protein
MFVARYVALAALVLLLTDSVAASGLVAGAPGPHYYLASLCALVVLIALFVMKFVGPPPHAFVLRGTLIFTAAALSLYAGWFAPDSPVAARVNLVLGLILLGWYARE